MIKAPTIFVNIAAYRDSEAYPTIQDLFEKAADPSRIHVGLCWQYSTLREEPFQLRDRHHQISVINVDYKRARGACWARRAAQCLYGNETYYLQVDAHSRFIPGWDEAMIEELAKCPSEKPILSTYPNHYNLPNEIVDHGPYKMIFNEFHNQVPSFHSRSCEENERQIPTPSLVVSGGLVFTRGSTITEVPYDPYVYFIGEEISMSVRYWTHGYDLFTPTRTLVFHLYAEPESGKNLHWKDHPDWHDNYESYSRQRVLHLLNIENTGNPNALREMGRYDLGHVRTLAEYEAYAGIDLRGQTFSENAKLGNPSA